MIDFAGIAAALTAGSKFVGALRGLFGGKAQEETRPPTEAELHNQRQEQAAGAARNYSSRRTERAAKQSKP